MEHLKYRPDIDGLRAIAILSVLVFHYFPGLLPGGYIGVDIFFVISGYLISSIIFKNLQNHRFSFYDFYVRRVWRIFPALLAALFFILIFGLLFFTPDEFTALGKHIAGSATFTSNFLLWRESGYFDISAETKPLLHLWSLGIEEQFYLLWPLMVWTIWKFRANVGIAIFSLMCISFLLNVTSISHDPVSVFYHPSTRFWELLAGAALAFYEIKSNLFSRLTHKQGGLLSVTGIVLIAIGLVILDKNQAFPGWWALLPVTGAFLVIAAGKDGWVNKNLLSLKILTSIGLFSFSLYLWHWIFLSISRLFTVGEPSLLMKLVGIFLSFLFAIISYFFIEKPSKKLVKTRPKTLLILIGMALLGFSGYAVYVFKGFDNRFDAPRLAISESASSCDGQWGGSPCIVGNPKSKMVVVIYGDSHAGHLINAIVNASGDKFKIIFFGQNCYSGFVNGQKPKTWGVSEEDCNSRLKIMSKLKGENVYAVIRSQRWDKYNFSTVESVKEQLNEVSYAAGLNPQKIILVGSAPEVNTYCEIASYYLPVRRGFCNKNALEMQQNSFFMRNAKSIGLPKNVFIVDPYDALCKNGFCEVIHGNASYYFDTNHLTTDGAGTFTKEIVTILKEQLVSTGDNGC